MAIGGRAVGTSLRFDAVTVLTVILVLLVALPADLVVSAFGGVGAPAILAGLLVLFWWALARIVPELGAATGRQPVRVVLLVLAGAALASFAAAMARPLTDSETGGAYRGLITVGFWMGLALLAADGITSRARLDLLLRRLVLAATVLAVAGICQFFTGYNPTAFYQHIPGLVTNTDLAQGVDMRAVFRRVEATANHPIEFSATMAIALTLAIHFAFNSGPRRRLERWLGVGILAVAMIMSVSRSGILGISASGLILLWSYSWRRRAQALALVASFVLLVYLAIPGMLGTLRYYFLSASSDPSVTGRIVRYPAAFTLYAQAPWFGRGFKTLVPNVYLGLVGIGTLDNQYLTTLIEMGIVGLAAILLVMLVPVFMAWTTRRHMSDPTSRDLALTLGASLLVPLITCATFDVLFYQIATGYTFIVIGCCGALWRLERTRRSVEASTRQAELAGRQVS
jgi:O-antigen ligase